MCPSVTLSAALLLCRSKHHITLVLKGALKLWWESERALRQIQVYKAAGKCSPVHPVAKDLQYWGAFTSSRHSDLWRFRQLSSVAVFISASQTPTHLSSRLHKRFLFFALLSETPPFTASFITMCLSGWFFMLFWVVSSSVCCLSCPFPPQTPHLFHRFQSVISRLCY